MSLLDGFMRGIVRVETATPPWLDPEVPRYGGTWIVAMGPPRCGKTHSVCTLAFTAALHYGLPLLAQDPTGNVRDRLIGFRSWAKDNRFDDPEYSERVIAFLDDHRRCRLYPGKSTSKMLAAIDALVGDGSRNARAWQAVVLLDEGAIIRGLNPEFFDRVAPLFGNAGLFGYVTEQREVGVPPSLRACIRRYLLWQGATKRPEVSDWDLDPLTLTTPRGRVITTMDPATGHLDTWDQGLVPPLELITPAAVSLPIAERINL